MFATVWEDLESLFRENEVNKSRWSILLKLERQRI